jgi:toxin FitB
VAGFLLDTNVLSEFARAQAADERVDRWLKATPEESLFASILTFAEIRRGIELLPAGKRRDQLEEWQNDLETSFVSRLLPMTKDVGEQWSILPAQAQR